ncbi:hypothetical protein D3C87_492160 [compost metagenome]|jgi:hypothetical protein|nr:hypothetical protein ATCR1_08479 [Agrobacterium tumefaciens CCNWGS0286]
MLGLKAVKVTLNCIHYMSTRGGDIVSTWSHSAVDLCSKHDLRAWNAKVFEGLPQCLFAGTGRVDIGRVEKIDSSINTAFDQFVSLRLAYIADVLVNSCAVAEGHRPEAKLRNESAGVSECLVLHLIAPMDANRHANGILRFAVACLW